MLKKFLFACTLLLCACVPEVKREAPSAGSTDLNMPVIIGGSILSGYRDGALFDAGQQYGAGEQILESFAEVSGKTPQTWRMGSDEGIGWNFGSPLHPFRTRGRLANLADCEGEIGLGVDRDYLDIAGAGSLLGSLGMTQTPQNYSIPFATLPDLSDASFSQPIPAGGRNAFFPRIAATPGSSTVLGDIASKNPTFFVFAPGWDDIYTWASLGMESHEPLAGPAFQNLLDLTIGQLTANGAKGVLLTLPDPDAMPFFTTFPTLGLELDTVKADSLNMLYGFPPFDEIRFHTGDNGFVIHDTATASDYRLTTANDRILLNAPKDSIKCKKWGIVFTPLPDSVVIRVDELITLRARINEYNTAIRALAAQYNLALAETGNFLENIRSGYREDGIDYSSLFVSGGFYSLDGLNPTPRGAALLANVILRAINEKYGANIPTQAAALYEGIIFP